MRTLIFGSGAVGGYLGVKLALAGHAVSFLARPHALGGLRQHGFILSGDGPPAALPEPKLYSDVQEALEAGQPQFILLCVKAYAVAEAARSLAGLLGPSHTVVSFLNGVNNERTLREVLDEPALLPATLTTAVQMNAPGDLRVARVRGIGLAGEAPGMAELTDALRSAGLTVQHYPHPGRMKWSKLLTNIVSNASSAILGWSAGEVFDHPLTARLEIEALREAVRVMRALGMRPHNLPGVQVGLLGRAVFFPAAMIRRPLGRIVGSGRGQKRPSFHYDIGRGHSEVAWLNGAVVRYGERTGVPTPVNRLLTETMLDLVEGRLPHEALLGKPEALLQRLAA